MRAVMLAALCLAVTLVAFAPASEARPPGPGGGCHVVGAYITEASIDTNPEDGDVGVEPGAPRPVECYY
jgi:hypothetical protein